MTKLNKEDLDNLYKIKQKLLAHADIKQSVFTTVCGEELLGLTGDFILGLVEMAEELEKYDSQVTMGVGDGAGSLFVQGDSESIKTTQRIVLERDELRRENQRLKDENDKLVRTIGEHLNARTKYYAHNMLLREALVSISKNTCCDRCQEAKCVALKALANTSDRTYEALEELEKVINDFKSDGEFGAMAEEIFKAPFDCGSGV